MIPAQNESTPFIGPVERVPRSVVSVQVVNTTADPGTLAETQPTGPTNVTVPGTPLTGSFNVTICANPSPVCHQPVAPSFTAHTEVKVHLQVG